jgi:S1-C subfamily serine protease
MKMSNVASTWQALSREFAGVIESSGRAVVAVHARRRIPSSGVQWRPGVVVTADHAVEREEEIAVTLPDGSRTPATLAGRDPSTDLAILKVEGASLPPIEVGDAAALKAGHWILAAGRTAEGDARAGLALVGVAGSAWRTRRGGELDRTLRLDTNLHPNLSGGPAFDDQGRVLGINTSGLSRFGAVIVPASTVERVVAELEKRGHIGHGYLGVGMQPVRLPRTLRAQLNVGNETAVLVMSVETDSPAEKAGLTLGDVLVGLDGSAVTGIDDVLRHLSADRIGKPVKASIIRGGALADALITVGERP